MHRWLGKRRTFLFVAGGGKCVPKGTNIIICLFHLHKDERYRNDPHKFDPDRFLPEEVDRRPPCSFIPFSYGPRNCIGKFLFQ